MTFTYCFNGMQSYLSSAEFREKFSMTRAAFYKLPKWKQNKLKSGVQLF
jgi:gelsolin